MKRFVAMRIYVMLICAAGLVACGLEEMGTGQYAGQEGIWYGPSYGKNMSGTVYTVGLDYPSGYDWRADADKGMVKCSLVLFADGIPVLKVPVGDGYEVSSDQSCHRVRNGHLYTDYTDGKSTVLKRDGKEIARYDGAEEILCFEVFNGKIHTLNRRKGSEGFVYRVDGNLVLERQDGNPFLHMAEHADSVRFCFRQTQKTATGNEERYYESVSGTVRQIGTATDSLKIRDMKIIDGNLYSLADIPGKNPVILHDGKEDYAAYLIRQNVVSCSFCDSDSLCVNVRCRYSGSNTMTDILWTGGNEWTMYRMGQTLSAVHADADGINAVINPSDGRDGMIFSGRTAHLIPQGYRVYSRDCMTRRDSVLYVGLSSGADAPAIVWKNGVLDTLKINGPITCLR